MSTFQGAGGGALFSKHGVGGNSRLRLSTRTSGFTVVELVTCIVLIGIVGAVVAPRFFDNQAFSERGYIDEVAFSLRYARQVAIASQCNVAVTVNGAGYTAMQRAAAGNNCSAAGAWTLPVRRIDGSTLSGTPPAGVALAPNTVIEFTASGAVNGGAPPALNVGVYTLTVDAVSGQALVQP